MSSYTERKAANLEITVGFSSQQILLLVDSYEAVAPEKVNADTSPTIRYEMLF